MFRRLFNLVGRPTPPSIALDLPVIKREHDLRLLAATEMETSELVSQYPPQIEHSKKRLLFELAMNREVSGALTVYRYGEIPVPENFTPVLPETTVAATSGFFRYCDNDSADHWYMNFAHHNLFNGYGHFMFAQDEIQVAEHPAMASAREMMLARQDELRPLTVENGNPTPVLFRNVPRTIDIRTNQIYGARFARAEDDTIRDATRHTAPVTYSNILAIEAPISSGNKMYSADEIEYALRTAYSGFRAVVLASATYWSAVRPIVLHTGNWGCGAYGGNRQLMLTIQMMAARLAGLNQIVFHCGSESVDDVSSFDSMLRTTFSFRPGVRLANVLKKLVSDGFEWGASDGN